jgi:uncharacterized membrane protein YgcG
MVIKWRQFLVPLLVICSTAVWAAEHEALPLVKSRINDHAGILSTSQMHLLYQLLAQHEVAKRQHVVVLTAVTSGSDAPQAYAERVWQAWPSQKKPSAVLLVLFQEQKSAAIVAGEELNKVLDTAAIRQIIGGDIAANLQKDDFDNAALEGVKGIVARINR